MSVKHLILVLFGLALFAMASTSSATARRCDGCNTDEDYKRVAMALGQGTHQIYNVRQNTMQTWRVPASQGSAKAGTAAADQGPEKAPNSNAALNELGKGHKLYVIGKGTLRPIISVPVSRLKIGVTNGRTIYDVVNDSNLRGQIASAAANQDVIDSAVDPGVNAVLEDIKNQAASYPGIRGQAGLLIRIVMDDGGYFDIKLDLDDTAGKPLMDTARTASGQLVPLQKADVNGTWTDAPGDNLSDMVEHFRGLGLDLDIQGNGPMVRSIVCSGGVCHVHHTLE